ncbi:MAG: polysaccharide deacetylase family protein [Candidatus Moraniibacteriota bacterium]|nr:MAG: polysaccharide deacetylase family protein [Candidatus Moranbacteria bacterium]
MRRCNVKYAEKVSFAVRRLFLAIFCISGLFSSLLPPSLAAVNGDRFPLVAIVFDDAHRSFPYAIDRMHREGLVGTVYVPTRLIGAYDFHATWKDIERARDSGWEIANHSATHANLTKIPIASVVDEIEQSSRDLERHGIRATSFAAPYGEFTRDIQSVVMMRFSTNRMAWGESVILPENLDVRAIPVFDLSHVGTSYDSMESILQKVLGTQGLVVIVFHKIAISTESSADPVDRFTVKRGDFDLFLRRVSGLRDLGKLRCVTISGGVQEIAERIRQK